MQSADTETVVFHWFKTKTKCQISVTGERNKTDRLQISNAIIRRKSVQFIVNIFPRGKSCFVQKLKIVAMIERLSRGGESPIAHISPRIRIILHWTLISTFFFFEERFEVLFFRNQKKGKSFRGEMSTIDYNRYRSVKRVSGWLFSPAMSFSRAFFAGNLFNRFDMSLTEGALRDS